MMKEFEILQTKASSVQLSTECPLVSVVVPCYNRAKLIPRAVRSVQEQSFESLEIVLVDDGSSDDTVSVVERLKANEHRIRFLRHERNRGEAAARNTGVRNARGKYIAFLDSDDEWLPCKLKSQFELLSQTGDKPVGCVTSLFQSSPDGRTDRIHDWSDRLPITDVNVLTCGCGLALGTSLLVPRAVYEVVGYYDESLPLLVDLDWLCRYLQAYPLVKLPVPLARYHKSPMRRGEFTEQAIGAFLKKNAGYLSGFKLFERWKIKSQFYAYISQSYEVHGPQTRFLISRGLCLLYNPFQSLRTHLHWVGALFRIVRIGKSTPVAPVVD
jgi:glycosyltransferase involved in cell wall biosynthesis